MELQLEMDKLPFGALGLAIGIGIQNIPEGAALSMPIRAAGATRFKSI